VFGMCYKKGKQKMFQRIKIECLFFKQLMGGEVSDAWKNRGEEKKSKTAS